MEFTKNKPLRVFEAFVGYGSQSMALARLRRNFPEFDFEVIGISDISKNAIAAYHAVHGEHIHNYGDISKINWGGLPDFDLLTYSFPCQDISTAGKQKGFVEGTGTRSSLLWECAKAVESKHPKYLLMENVKALIQKKFMPEFQKWREWLESQGYRNYWQVMNAKHYGVPQNRERVFMVSILDPMGNFKFPDPFPLERKLRDVLEDEVDEKYYLSDDRVQKIISHCDRKQAEGCGFKPDFNNGGGGTSNTLLTRYGQRETDTYLKEPK